MILALDVGNTNITCGVFDGDRIKASFFLELQLKCHVHLMNMACF